MNSLPRTTTLKRAAALLGASAAAAATAAAIGAAPASAATFSSAQPAAASSAVAVHPNVVSLGDCGEDYTVTGTMVNIRSRWGTSSPIISEAYKGDEFIADWRTSYTYNGSPHSPGVSHSGDPLTLLQHSRAD